jgi:hypothetical protein
MDARRYGKQIDFTPRLDECLFRLKNTGNTSI